MRISDVDYDDGKNFVTLEMKNSEISAVCYYLESLIILEGKSEDIETIHELHDSLLKIISPFSI